MFPLYATVGGTLLPTITSLSYSQFDTSGLGARVTAVGSSLMGCTTVRFGGLDVVPDTVTNDEVTFFAPMHVAEDGLTLVVETPTGISNALSCSYWGPEATSVPLIHDLDPAVETSLTLEAGAKVSVMLDNVGTLHQRQTIDNNRPVLVLSDPNYGGRPTLEHAGVAGKFFQSDAGVSKPGPVSLLFVGHSVPDKNLIGFHDVPYTLLDLDPAGKPRAGVSTGGVQFTPAWSPSTSSPCAILWTDAVDSSADSSQLFCNDFSLLLAGSLKTWGTVTRLHLGQGQISRPLVGSFARCLVWSGCS